MKFRKKPVIIEATQWFKMGDHPLDYTHPITNLSDGTQVTPEYRKQHNWEGDVVRYYRHPPCTHFCAYCSRMFLDHGWIDTLEGGHIVCPGDWIITGIAGEYYPCKPDIFEKTYERVENEQGPTQE